jgi:hypothetical protein
MGTGSKIIEFYIEIIVWVAIWGIVSYIFNEISNNRHEEAVYYVMTAIVGTFLLFYLFKNE